jgi:FAD/FMN-containing dehydrogenase
LDEQAVADGRADYGRIHFRIPKESQSPANPTELAELLRQKSAKGESVTIRNTGHSTNGQTLTNAVQVGLSRLTSVRFFEERRAIVAGAGASWDAVIQAARFPSYSPAVFPNNPGQLIRVGGTASVGGVGLYCSRFGGFWNHVSQLKLVTMRGEIIECSREENAELFRFALGGYGRIGVIAEVTIDVVPSKSKVLALVLAYFNDSTFEKDLTKAVSDPRFHVVAAQRDLSGWEARVLDALGVDLKLLIVMMEVDDDVDVDATIADIRKDYDEELALFLRAGANVDGLELSLKPRVFDKRFVVYFTPTEQSWWRMVWGRIKSLFTRNGWSGLVDPTKLCHPWTDCVIPPPKYMEFTTEATRIIRDYGLARSLEKESFLSGLVDIDSFVTFAIKRMWDAPSERMPLSLDLPDVEAFSYGVAIMPNVPISKLDDGLAMSRDISDLAYRCGGLRYLYGTHALTIAQVEQHYGRDVLEQWQRLKDEHDPKHLLNIGVVEHLDD